MPSDNDRLLMMSKGKIVGCGCLIIVIYLVLLMMCRLQSPESYVMEYLDRGAWRWGIVSVIFIILRKVFFLARRRNGKYFNH